jgi:hypothetical protein
MVPRDINWDVHLNAGSFYHNNPDLTPEVGPVNSERLEKKILDPETVAAWRRHFFGRRKFNCLIDLTFVEYFANGSLDLAVWRSTRRHCLTGISDLEFRFPFRRFGGEGGVCASVRRISAMPCEISTSDEENFSH